MASSFAAGRRRRMAVYAVTLAAGLLCLASSAAAGPVPVPGPVPIPAAGPVARALVKPPQTTSPSPTPTAYVNPYLSKTAKYTYTPKQVWYRNRRAWCFPIDDNGRNEWPATSSGGRAVQINPVLIPVYASGASAGFPIFQLIPTDDWYSDAVLYMKVVVPDTYPRDNIKSYQKLIQKGYPLYPSGYYNYPIVPKNSAFQDASQPFHRVLKKLVPKQGWYLTRPVYYFALGKIPTDPSAGTVVTGTMYQITNTIGNGTSIPVVDSIPNVSTNYTGFYAMKYLSSSASPNLYRSDVVLSELTNTTSNNTILNCPIVLVENNTFVGSPPGPAPPVISNIPTVQWVGPSSLYTVGPAANLTTMDVFWQNKMAMCWNFGTNSAAGFTSTGTVVNDQSSVLVNTVLFPIYKTPNSDGTVRTAGAPVFAATPLDGRYSDTVQAMYVTVNDSIAANQFKDYSTLIMNGVGISPGIFNYPVVPFGSTVFVPSNYSSAAKTFSVPVVKSGWYQGQEINYVDNGMVPVDSGHGTVPTSLAVVNGKNQTVISNVADPSDQYYSGFY
ncbi:hypothetical protein HK405_004429, partial [Cladochytrium tenue]